MTKDVLVDTDVLIDYSKGHDRSLANLLLSQSQGKITLFVNPVITAEFFADNKLRDKNKLSQALEFFNLFAIKEISKKIGLIAGELLRERKVNFLGDALIAATCQAYDLSLVTRNKKHYEKIDRLVFYQDPEQL